MNTRSDFVVANSIFTCSFGTPVDLNEVRVKFSNCRYDKNRFSGAIVKFVDPKITVLLFSTGSAVITGGKTREDVVIVVKKLTKLLRSWKYKPLPKDLRLRNVVAACSTGFPVNLYALYEDRSSYCVWELELFSGLKYKRARNNSVVAVVFSSGKFNVTGANSLEETKEYYEHVIEILKNYEIS